MKEKSTVSEPTWQAYTLSRLRCMQVKYDVGGLVTQATRASQAGNRAVRQWQNVEDMHGQ